MRCTRYCSAVRARCSSTSAFPTTAFRSGIYDWMLAHWLGLSETAMRLPMLLSGLATLVLFPLFAARRFGYPVAALFAVLLAISPLLVLYSRMARPYAITLLLGWIAHAAFHRYLDAAHGRRGAGFPTARPPRSRRGCTRSSRPSCWRLSCGRSPAGSGCRRTNGVRTCVRLLWLALPTGLAMAVLLVPPLVANPGVDVAQERRRPARCRHARRRVVRMAGDAVDARRRAVRGAGRPRRRRRLEAPARGPERPARHPPHAPRAGDHAADVELHAAVGRALPAAVPAAAAAGRGGRHRPGGAPDCNTRVAVEAGGRDSRWLCCPASR